MVPPGDAAPSLPDPAWTDGPATPAAEYPTVQDVCAAELRSTRRRRSPPVGARIVARTATWVDQMQDYYLQTGMEGGGGNALVIAAQLCAERRFETLTCLGGNAEAMARLVELHDQACAFADLLGRGALAGDAMRPNEVRPLSFNMYGQLFEDFEADLGHTLDQLKAAADGAATRTLVVEQARAVIAQREVDEAAGAAASAGLAARQQTAAAAQAAGYATTIQELEGAIQNKKLLFKKNSRTNF